MHFSSTFRRTFRPIVTRGIRPKKAPARLWTGRPGEGASSARLSLAGACQCAPIASASRWMFHEPPAVQLPMFGFMTLAGCALLAYRCTKPLRVLLRGAACPCLCLTARAAWTCCGQMQILSYEIRCSLQIHFSGWDGCPGCRQWLSVADLQILTACHGHARP